MKMYTNPKKRLQNYQNKKKQAALQKEDGFQERSLAQTASCPCYILIEQVGEG